MFYFFLTFLSNPKNGLAAENIKTASEQRRAEKYILIVMIVISRLDLPIIINPLVAGWLYTINIKVYWSRPYSSFLFRLHNFSCRFYMIDSSIFLRPFLSLWKWSVFDRELNFALLCQLFIMKRERKMIKKCFQCFTCRRRLMEEGNADKNRAPSKYSTFLVFRFPSTILSPSLRQFPE